jgi:hypothetical protein
MGINSRCEAIQERAQAASPFLIPSMSPSMSGGDVVGIFFLFFQGRYRRRRLRS